MLSFGIIVLFHIFIMANNVTHISRYYVSSLMKHLFKSLCVFKLNFHFQLHLEPFIVQKSPLSLGIL